MNVLGYWIEKIESYRWIRPLRRPDQPDFDAFQERRKTSSFFRSFKRFKSTGERRKDFNPSPAPRGLSETKLSPMMEKPSSTPVIAPEVDSDTEDDPGKLLNVWLGELDKMKQGLDSPPPKAVLRRKPDKKTELKNQYRCSLINLEETRDDELDAILGELSVLESQFTDEIKDDNSKTTTTTTTTTTETFETSKRSPDRKTGPKPRTDSPPVADNDSAFCDNVSVLSSSSSVRTDRSAKSSSGVSSSASPTTTTTATTTMTKSKDENEDDESRIKAEKIKLAIEKIKEASIKKLFIKVFTADESAKSLLVDEKMSVGHVTRILAEKNHVKLHPKWALVELIPDLYMERVYEDHENLVENCLLWKMDSRNTLWFVERPEKFDFVTRPENYLLGSTSSQNGESMEDHSRRELLDEYFSSGTSAPEVEGTIHLKAEGKKSWKRHHFVLRSSGLYYFPKGKRTSSSKDLVCLATFDVNEVYYGTGWRKKYKAPTDYCFAIKNPAIQTKNPKYIRYLCVETETELHRWVTGIRIAKNGQRLYDNYRGIEEEIAHEDIDILTLKRLSGGVTNARTGNDIKGEEEDAKDEEIVTTPSSENKSFDSALSSSGGISLESKCESKSESKHENHSESISSNESNCTPVNTMDRASILSTSSSSSGCPSSKSSNNNLQTNGFEADFPAGVGTIKKRPTPARLPLTSSTPSCWNNDDDDDNDDNNDEDDDDGEDNDEDDNGANVRVGGGGTLLRPAIRDRHRVVHTAQIHRDSVDPLSEEFENNLEDDFPPPPSPCPPPLPPSVPNVNEMDLPPPPPELLNEEPRVRRRISFDDHVQMIDDYDDLPPPPPFPNKLDSPPKAFLRDLQRVMTKKWQIAEKCREDREITPHHVLGFRDEVSHLVGNPQKYSRDDSVGQWILQSQIYNTSEPLYAVSAKTTPVVLREPTPEYDHYRGARINGTSECSNYSTINFNNTTPRSGSFRGHKNPPPPPRRSENTHLTTQS